MATADEAPDAGLLTLDEVCEQVGMSVRNVRFYTTRGLVPPPLKRGRQGFYTPVHVARLELVRELQAHGFTLAAIEKYVARVPADATPESIVLHRTLLAPWTAEQSETLTRAELDDRAGRVLTDDELEVLVALEAITLTEDGRFEVATSLLDACFVLIQFGYPKEAAAAARDIFTEHATVIAESLNALFHELVWPAFRASGAKPEDLQRAVESIKPITTAALVSHYEAAVTRAIGGRIARLTGDAPAPQR
ncbi:MerR family transcriptional regulator [Nocardioides daejeonensis]|uniref:MerR family transcriptional regulator n=1 Tax=Nocardioides daejeonensis TaxID=1046556 RepID=UPI000D7404C2|nr:MerR family transcriptional regulator [Nocardioides daejeonensis]